MHGWQLSCGDDTPRLQGRLNINPLSHMDPLGTICLLFGGFGWGKPVQINPVNFKHPEKDGAKVAFAGPVMNLILSLVCAVLFAVVGIIGYKTGSANIINGELYAEPDTPFYVILTIIINTMILNLGLAIFNLLPFPPLDGSKIFRAFAKGKVKQFLYDLERYSMIIILILFATHIASYIINPIVIFILDNILLPIIENLLSVV